MKQTILSAGLLLILIIPASLSAEILYMKNGEIVRGRIVFQSSDSVSIQSEGRTRALNKADIRRISYNDEEEKTNEQRDNRLQQMMNRQQDLMVENNRLKQELARRDEAEKEKSKDADRGSSRGGNGSQQSLAEYCMERLGPVSSR